MWRRVLTWTGVFLCAAASGVPAQEAYEPVLRLDEVNRQLRITMFTEEQQPLLSPFDRGTVAELSRDRENATGLGRYVAVDYELGFEFEGRFQPQGELILVYGNVASVDVQLGQEVSQGDRLATTIAGGPAPETDFSVFILTTTPNNRYLEVNTGNRKQRYGVWWYWDASFLF
jgi:hypothetical protein